MYENAFIMESFNCDPLDMIREDFCSFSEGVQFLENVITEASQAVSKKNVFKRLWELIKKLFGWLSLQWTKFINFCKTKILRQNMKTVDQLAIEMNIPRHEVDKNFANNMRIKIPSHDNSEVKIDEEIELVCKPVLVEFMDNKKIKFNFIWNAVKMGYKMHGKIKGHKDTPMTMGPFLSCMEYIQNPVEFDKIKDLLNEIVNADVITKELQDKCNKFTKEYSDKQMKFDQMNKTFEYTIDQLITFQKSLNEADQIIRKIDDPFSSFKEDRDVSFIILTLNAISGILAAMQMCMNAITSSLKEVALIDGSYYGSVDSVETLSKFVKKMIDNGIPSKYVSYNTYLISSKKIRGIDSEANKPCWGQSRVTFFPEDKSIVHKIALSGWGIRSNFSEHQISDAYKEYNGDHLIAVCNKDYNDHVIIDSERVEIIHPLKVKQDDISKLKTEMQQLISDHKIPFFISDLHVFNVGKKNGKLVALDYGFTHRTSLKAISK